MSAKTYRLLTILIILLGAIGIGGIGLSLIAKYLQTQQIQQIQQANNLLAQEKYDSALTAYDRLLETQKLQLDRLWTNRGYALLGLKQYEEALESCTTATSIQPKADLAWNCQGEALYNLDRQDDALAAFKQAIAFNPRNPTFQLNKGRVLTNLSQHEKAIEVLSKAISQLESQSKSPQKSEELAIAFNDLGQSLLVQQQNKRALAAFERALSYRPEFFTAQQGLGISLYRSGRYQQAIEIFNKILQQPELTREQQAINWLYKGISLCETTQTSAATEAFAEVVKLTENPQSREIAQAGCGIR